MYKPLISRSFFLFGARGTGKSTWLASHFSEKNALFVDLLKAQDAEQFIAHPQNFEAFLEQARKQKEIEWIVVDEVQKEPRLLDAVHREIENGKRFKFALTGSSARKLKRGGANLLAGRAGWNTFFPLTFSELGDQFQLDEVLNWGSLPSLLGMTQEEKTDYLRTYVQVYLKEEILEEQLVRNAPGFRRFLEIAAQMNGKILNYAKIGKDVGTVSPTVKTYFDILEDTYLGFRLHAFHHSIRQQQKSHPKFYLFDNGVWRAILRSLHSPFVESTGLYGHAFEVWLMNEFYRLNEGLKLDYAFSYLQTKDDAEIDLILERPGEPLIAIEIKSSTRIDESEVTHLETLAKDLGNVRIFYLSRDPIPKKIGRVECLPWRQGISEIFPVGNFNP